MRVEGLKIRHLKGSEGQVKEYFIIFCDGFTGRNENNIMDPKQRDQQESGFGQPPEAKREISRCLLLLITSQSLSVDEVCLVVQNTVEISIKSNQKIIRQSPKCNSTMKSTNEPSRDNGHQG